MNKRKAKSETRKPSSVGSPESPIENLDTAMPKPAGNGSYPVLESGAWVLHEDTQSNAGDRRPFDLAERTAVFGEAIIRFAKRIPRGPGNDRIIDQLVGAGTSVGANYCEANESCSKRDFLHSISRCSKEAKETKHFLRMAAATEPKLVDEARRLYREANELHLIFASIFRKGGGRNR